MQFLNFTVIKFTLYLVLGILFGYYYPIDVSVSVSICLLLTLALGVTYFINKNSIKKTIVFGTLTFITFFFIGILTTTFHNQQNHLQHYTKKISDEFSSNLNITFKVREVLKAGNYHDKYVINFKSIEGIDVTGKSLLNVQKDSTKTSLKVDDVVLTKTIIRDLIPPLNPNQFDYKDYLQKKHIYHQLYTTSAELLILKREKNSAFGLAAQLRETINLKLKKYNFKPDELSIINALILGQRQDISKEIYDSYTQAGAIHILAVSGLHVGIVLLILNFLFKPIERFKHGTIIKTIIIVILLWCFAVIAGLSASVTRAVTMFSIVAIGMNYKRQTNIYNTLAISMFVLLLFKPNFLFDVGFQMSYLAVFSIVWIQPLLYKLWSPKLFLVDKFWQIFTVTIAAQLGVFPISLFYFHQFPSLFFISNLVIIPFLGTILGLGILIIVLVLLNSLPQFLASTFGYVISLMNDFVTFISKQEAFLFKHISFGILSVISSYILIIAIVKLYQKISFKYVSFALLSIALFISVLIFNEFNVSTSEFLIFHKSRYSIIGIKQNKNLILHHNLDSLFYLNDNLVVNYKVGNSIKDIKTDSIKSIYKINDKLLLVVDSLGAYRTSFKPDYVLLRNSPKINLNKLIDHLQPDLIIADGSNYKTYQERWLETCLKKELPFYQTSKKGALIIK